MELIPKLLSVKKCPNPPPQNLDKYSRVILMAAELRRISDEVIHIQLQRQKTLIGSKLENKQLFASLGSSPKNRVILDEQLKKIRIALQQQLHSLDVSLKFLMHLADHCQGIISEIFRPNLFSHSQCDM